MNMCSMEAVIFYFLEVMTNVNFFLNWSNVKVKILSTVPTERSYLKEYSCEISKLNSCLIEFSCEIYQSSSSM